MRRVLVLTVLVCLLVPATAPTAPRDVIRDCTDNGRIDSDHSQDDYKGALRRLPSDVDEYTECRRIIEKAKRDDARQPPGGGGETSGGGGIVGGFSGSSPPPAANIPANPGEVGAIAQATGAGTGDAPVAVAGEPITPGGSGVTEAAFRHALPAPLLLVVILFGLGALATTISGARSRGLHAPAAVLRVFDRVFPRRA